jgi:hypothetical protein
MLYSLFGELGPQRLPTASRAPQDLSAIATAVQDSDVVFDADAAQALRHNFESTRSDLGASSSMITLLDPSGLWAPQVIHALADAGGQRVERIHLRERSTLRTMATIERTNVPRLSGQPLKVYHAAIRVQDGPPDALAHALAEHSHLTAVIIGAMAPHAVTEMLRGLLSATSQPEWRCPWLVFILPPGASALRQRILEQDWPQHVRTAAMSESLSGAATVWNAVLTAWEAAAQTKPWSTAQPGSPQGDRDSMVALAPPQWLAGVLSSVVRTEGVISCGIAELDSGNVIAVDADNSASAELRQLAAAMCAARRAHVAAGGPGLPVPDELLVTIGARHMLLRPLAKSQSLAFVALVERSRANLALLRYRLMESERHPV